MFEHDDPLLQPDPHFQAPGGAGLLFVFTGLAQALLMIFASVLALIDTRDPMILVFGVLLRGLPPVGHLVIGVILLALANVGRKGPLPGPTRYALAGAAVWGLLVAVFDLCTCNVLVLPFDLFCVAASIGGAVFLTTRIEE